MTIAALILTCLIFVSYGWTGSAYAPVALCIGAVVCIAACNGGATSQDLKTGYIVGATPVYQQIGLLIGVVASALVVGATTIYLHRVFGIGSPAIAAPQATLMATIIRGLLSHNLPWGLVLVGVFIAITLELCGIHSLSFAVGAYLPIATTAPIMAGGVVRWYVEHRTGVTNESEAGAGTLFSSGLIAGGSPSAFHAVLVGVHRTIPGDRQCAGFPASGNERPGGDRAVVPDAGDGAGPGGTKTVEMNFLRSRAGLFAAGFSLVASSAGHPAPQGTVRRAASPAALLAFPGFFHGQPVVVRGTLATRDQAVLMSPAIDRSIPLMFSGPSPADGPVEMRATFWDVGRFQRDDARLQSLELNGLVRANSETEWPRPGEIVALIVTDATAVTPADGPPPLRLIALEPTKYIGQRVKVTGQFRGRNPASFRRQQASANGISSAGG